MLAVIVLCRLKIITAREMLNRILKPLSLPGGVGTARSFLAALVSCCRWFEIVALLLVVCGFQA